LFIAIKLTGPRVIASVQPEPTPTRSSAWFSGYLSVRPPPAI
jgi:hypothetical protein